MSDYCPACGLEIFDIEDDCLCSATATTSGAPLSERVRDEADEWRKAFDLGDVTDSCESCLRELAVEIAALEAERDEAKRMVEVATKDAADAIEQANAVRAERDESEAYLMDTLNQLDDLKLVLVDCLKKRRRQLRNVEAERDRLRKELDRIALHQSTPDVIQYIARAALEGGDDETTTP